MTLWRRLDLQHRLAGVLGSLALPALALACGLCVLLALFALPIQRSYDVGHEAAPIEGVYGSENSGLLSFVYTTGDAMLRVPQVGQGNFVVELRLASPGMSAPTNTRLLAGAQQIELGDVRALRSYQVLVPADAAGVLTVRIANTPVRVEGDPRPLGVLVDRIHIHSVGPALPSKPVLLSAAVAIAVASTMLAMTGCRRRTAAYLATGAAVGAVFGLSRGWLDLPPPAWVLLAGLFALGGLWLQANRWYRVRPLLGVAALFCFWRAGMWLLSGLGMWYSEAFAPIGLALSRDGNNYGRDSWLWYTAAQSWMQWDSEHYILIARDGYSFYGERWPNVAFFPLYSLVIKAVAPLVGQQIEIAGLLVANVALLAALLLLYDLLAADFGPAIAWRSLTLLLLLPTSFFFAALYSESLALALLVGSVWAIRRQRWWLAGCCGMLLALTRIPGIFIAPILALAYLQHLGWRWRAVRWPILAAGLPPLGLAAFMLYQWQRFGTPLAFMQAQASWENSLSLPWVQPLRLAEMIATSPDWPILAFQALFWIGFLALLVGAARLLPPLYSLTLAGFLLPPYLSSWTWSISRHVLLGFPAVVVLALWAERPAVRRPLMGALLALLIVATLLFVNGFWVA